MSCCDPDHAVELSHYTDLRWAAREFIASRDLDGPEFRRLVKLVNMSLVTYKKEVFDKNGELSDE